MHLYPEFEHTRWLRHRKMLLELCYPTTCFQRAPEFLTWFEKASRAHGKAEVIIGKQRHGPTGTVELQFDGRFTRFGNLAREDSLPERFE